MESIGKYSFVKFRENICNFLTSKGITEFAFKMLQKDLNCIKLFLTKI